MIGLSHYPQTHSTKLWQEMNLLALKHISQLAKTFQVKVMITEIGVKQNDSASAQVLADFYKQSPRHGILRWCMVLGTGMLRMERI